MRIGRGPMRYTIITIPVDRNGRGLAGHDPNSLADGRHPVNRYYPGQAWLRRNSPRTPSTGCTTELEDLRTRGRIDIARAIEAARALGDLSENGDYHAAKDAQGKMESRIRQLEAMLADVVIVDTAGATDRRGQHRNGRGPAIRRRRRRRAVPHRLHRGAPGRGGGGVPELAARPGPDGQEGRRTGVLRRPERPPRGRDRRGRRSRS